MASRATQTDTGIDPRIAELLGLDFTGDLDREDYISLLKEKMMAGRMSSSKLSSEETEVLTDEFKRVKKDTQKTFKVKKTQISAESFKKQSPTAMVGRSQRQKALPGSAGRSVRSKPSKGGALVKQGGEDEREPSILEKISAGVNSILKTLKEDREFKKKLANQERRSTERKIRSAKEDKLESGIFKNILKGAKKILKPVEGILGRILKFIGTILIGKVLKKIVAWMSDPKNEGKLDAIGNFLKVTWPAILGAFLIFSTGFGGVITGLIALVAKFIPRIAATIFKLAASNPLAAAAIAGAGLFVAGYAIPKLMPGTVDEQEGITEGESGTTEEKITKLKEQKKNLSLFQRMQGVGLEIDEQIKFLETGKTAAYSGGGIVRGFAGGGHAMAHGTDTVPAMLTPGEFVMSRGAVQKYGSGTLASMNAAGGGTNRPTMLGGTVYASGGGHVHKGERKLQGDSETENADLTDEQKASMFDKAGIKSMGDFVRSNSSSGAQSTTPLIPTKVKKEKTNTANAEQIAAAFLSTLEASGGQHASDAFQVMLNRAADAQAGGSMRVYGNSLFNQITAREQFSPYSSALYGSSADGAAASKYGKIAKSLGANPAERKKKLLEIAGGSNGLKELEKLFGSGSASVAATVLSDHQSNGNLSKKSREFIGNKVSFRGYSTTGAVRRGPGGNYFFGPGSKSKVGSLKEVSTGEQSISFSGGSSSDISSNNGGGSGEDNETSGGGGDAGLKMLMKIMRAQSKLMSSTPTAKIGSQPPPSSPPSPPLTSSPTVTVADSAQQSGANQTPISETVSYVPVIPSAPKDASKVTVLGIA